MANVRPETLERLKNFSKSDKFKSLKPETQSRLMSFVGADNGSVLSKQQSETESNIASRDNPVTKFVESIKSNIDPNQINENNKGILGLPKGPGFGTAQGGIESTFNAMSVVGQNGIAATFNPLIEGTKEIANDGSMAPIAGGVGIGQDPMKAVDFFKRAFKSTVQGATGERLGQGGDFFYNLGINRPLSSALGFASEVTLDPSGIRRAMFGVTKEGVEKVVKRGARRIRKNARVINKDIVVKNDILDKNGNVIVAKGTVLAEKGKTKPTFKQKEQNIISNINRKYKNEKRTVKDTVEFLTRKIDDETEKIVSKVDDDIKIINNVIQKDGREAASKIQKKLPQMIKRNNAEYGKRIDEFSETLSDIGAEITDSEYHELLKRTLDELSEMALEDTRPFKLIQKQLEKYTPRVARDISTGKSSVIPKPIPFRKILKEFRSARDAITKTVIDGNQIADENAVASAVFQKNFGQSIVDRLPNESFKALQKKQAKIMEVHKAANKLFNPAKGDTGTDKSRRLFEKIAEGKAKPEDLTNLAKIQKQIVRSGMSVDEFVDTARRYGAEKARRTQLADDAKYLAGKNKRKIRDEAKKSLRELEDAESDAIEIISKQAQKIEAWKAAKAGNIKRNTIKGGLKLTGGILGYEILRRDLRKILGSNE